MNKINLADLLPFIEETFDKGKEFKIPITGTSMNPLLFQGRDYVLIKKVDNSLKIGDIPLYRRRDNSFILHRIVGKDEKGYIMCGDNQFILEYGITDENIIGVVSKMNIDGNMISVDDKKYIKHKEKYVRNVGTRYPLRRFRYKMHRLLKNGRTEKTDK